nr:5'-nucleotidase [Motiliproteus sp. SC1-56]
MSRRLVVGISSRALFDLEDENRIFEAHGVDAYRQYQRDHEDEVLAPGAAFPLIRALLRLNDIDPHHPLVEVVIMSRNTADTGLRIFNSISHYQLGITRAAFSGGRSNAAYLDAFSVDLFLSRSARDVQAAVDSGIAAAEIYAPPEDFDPDQDQIRIAFDGDAVLFSDASERIYQQDGLEAFARLESELADVPLDEGPFAKLLKTLSYLQRSFPAGESPVRIALVTARNSPTHARVINTLRAWQVDVDEAFFMGGVSKHEILRAFRAHIFFDDQESHLQPASRVVPSGRVPQRSFQDNKKPAAKAAGLEEKET